MGYKRPTVAQVRDLENLLRVEGLRRARFGQLLLEERQWSAALWKALWNR